jgi:spore coat protein CotH
VPTLALLALLIQATREAPPEPEYARTVFDDSKVHTIHLIVSGDDYAKLGKKPFDWVKAAVEIDGESFSEVGLREKGNSSAGIRSVQEPFKIDFGDCTKGQRCHGLKMLVLNNGFKDPTLLREKLAYDLFRAAGCPASRAAHAAVYVTAKGSFEKSYFGLYTMVEHVDEVFLDERFGGHEGNLYKPEGMQDLFGRADENRIKDKKAVELKTNEQVDDRTRLIEFVKAVADGKSDLEKWLDVDSFLAWLVANTALVNLDSYAGTGHNYYLYDDPKKGRFVVIPWDLNEAFANFQMGPPEDHLDWDVFAPFAGKKALIERVLGVAANRTKYAAMLKSFCEKHFAPKGMNGRIDALHKLTLDAATKDTKKEHPTATLVKSIGADLDGIGMGPKQSRIFGLKPFVEKRCASILEQLAGKRKGKTLQGMGQGPGPGGGPRGDPIKEMDKDGDGRVSRKEWKGPPEDFDRIDRNGDGQLDGTELKPKGPP